MKYIKLGNTGLDVSPIALGCMTYGDPGRGHPVWSLGEDESRPLIKQALEAGINFFDTANMYSQGSSEEITGRALKDFANRDEIVIATKIRHPMRQGPNGAGLSRKAIFSEIDHSLRRLGTDYVDLYQIHRMDGRTPIEETLEALHDLVKAGKVRYLGASSMHAWEFSKVLHLQRQHGWARASSRCKTTTTCWRARKNERCCRYAQTKALAPSSGVRSRAGASRVTVKGSPPAQSETPSPTCCTPKKPAIAPSSTPSRPSQARGVSRAQIALAWLRRNPVVVAPIVGATKPSHIDDAVASLDITLSNDEVTALEAPYTPRNDLQGISDDALLARISAKIGIKPASA